MIALDLDLNYYKKYNKINIGYKKNENIINNLTKSYNKQYNNAIRNFDILINSDRAENCYINLNKAKIIKVLIDLNRNARKVSTIPSEWREARFIPKSVNQGSYITLQSKYDNSEKTYLIIGKIEQRDGFEMSYIQECNNYISILDKTSNENKVIHIPCVKSNNTLYSDGIYENKTMKLLDGQIGIIVQKNDITSTFTNDMYFIFNQKDKYVVQHTYTDISSGIIQLIMKEQPVNPDEDNLELNIPNYNDIKHNIDVVAIQDDINIELGKNYKINYQIKDNGKIINDKEMESKIMFLSQDEEVLTVDNKGIVTPKKKGKGKINVILKLNDRIINKKILFSVLDEMVDNFYMDVVSEDNKFTIDYLTNKTFTVVFKKDAGNTGDKAYFELKNKDIKQRKPLAIIVNQTDTSCTIQANNKNRYGYMILTIKAKSGLCNIEKEIKIVNPFA